MLKAFTRNYEDNSTEAGYQFTFYCDICGDGFKSTFIESTTYKKGESVRRLTRGVRVLGDVFGGAAGNLGWNMERGGDVISERFDGRSPEWQKEHERAFNMAQEEVQQHFYKCHGCQKWVCDNDYNEQEGMCIECAPRQDVYVAKARAEAMKRNIDEAGESATVWQGNIESKTTVCPVCGKPTGNGKFCNNCGANLELNVCPNCGAKNSQEVKFCSNCGTPLGGSEPVAMTAFCPSCGSKLEPGMKFCGKCGTKI
ncbi:MAG: zinc ribbon domain-containing protein [Clostridiales bacterium]|nr:zinc ribbon domain-containing protein [Clostridiales bacterium]